jgi:hypothetical protein
MEHEQDREALLRRYIELKEKAKQLEAEIESLKSNLFFVISQICKMKQGKRKLFLKTMFSR